MANASLILLPGMDGTGLLFRPLLEVLPPDVSARVISYPADQALSYPDLLTAIEGELHSEAAMVLVAESFSGPLALRFAAAHPGRVRAVVLVGSFVSPPGPRWLRHLAWPVLFRLPIPKAVVRLLILGQGAPESLLVEVKSVIRRVRPEVLAGRSRDIFSVDCAEALRQCAAPILYLAGRDDALVRPSAAAMIASIRPDVTVATLEGPHLLLQLAPQAVWRTIEEFLQERRIWA